MRVAPWIDKSIQDFEFWVGATNFAPYLTTLSISQGISDMRSPLLWRGEFEVAYTFNCPLDEDDFSELDAPSRWREGLQQIRFIVAGYPVATMRIDNYRYLNGRGKGRLVQVLELAEFDRPAEEIPEVKISNGTQISRCVELLLRKAIADMPDPPTLELGDWESSEVYANYLTTTKPVTQAQELAGLYWRWIWVDTDEQVQLIQRPEKPQKPLFMRSLKEVVMEPHTEAIAFAAEKVIVSGARETAVPYKEFEQGNPNCQTLDSSLTQSPTDEQLTGLDDQNRPRKTVTLTEKARGLVFPPGVDEDGEPIAPDLTIIISERRTIHTRYGDAQDIFIGVALPIEILDTYYYSRKVAGTRSEAIASITISEIPKGTLVDNPFQPSAEEMLVVNSVEIESESFRASYKTKLSLGLEPLYYGTSVETFRSNYAAALTLFPEKYESVFMGLPLPKLPYTRISTSAEIDPETGEVQMNECDRKAEPRQKAPAFKIVTKPVKGVYKLRPNGYDPFQPRTYPENVGYLPSQEVANDLARQIALREIARRDSMLVDMPIPIEWLRAGCPPFSVAHIDRHCLLIDEPIITLDQGELKFGFTGERLGKIRRVPAPRSPIPWLPSGALEVEPIPVTYGLVGVAIAPITLQAYGGTPPYAFTGSLPTGLSIVLGQIVGTPTATVLEAASYSVMVTDDVFATASRAIAFIFEAVPPVELPTSPELDFDFGLVLSLEFMILPIPNPIEVGSLVLALEMELSPPIVGIIASTPLVLGLEITIT